MTSPFLQIRLSFINGLKEIVLSEISAYPNINVLSIEAEDIYIDHFPNFKILENLKSVSTAFVVTKDPKFHPVHLSNHKSIIGNLIELVLNESTGPFKTYRLTCAGSDSKEVREIKKYIEETYKVKESEDEDLRIHIIKPDDLWEVGVRLTRRPLSVRNYKIEHIKGGIHPTIAYAVNSLADISNISSYLNVFSGSATLLIEAAQINPNLTLLGFDIDKKTNSKAIQNIKSAGFIRSIQIKTADIFDAPQFGTFDVITSDLPFGMQISKNEDLESLYDAFLKYAESALNPEGKLIVYTSEYETFEKALKESAFKILETIPLKFMTSVNAYLRPRIFVCEIR